ncbi:hypothetical protein SLNHY_5578 [Streptomyces albus]|nr:hypothetical protein SLNHY_5578 [Streptomyces albus]
MSLPGNDIPDHQRRPLPHITAGPPDVLGAIRTRRLYFTLRGMDAYLAPPLRAGRRT